MTTSKLRPQSRGKYNKQLCRKPAPTSALYRPYDGLCTTSVQPIRSSLCRAAPEGDRAAEGQKVQPTGKAASNEEGKQPYGPKRGSQVLLRQDRETGVQCIACRLVMADTFDTAFDSQATYSVVCLDARSANH